jgi:hypothetical protein
VYLSPLRLLIAAAIFHLAITTTVFTLGRRALLPGTFDANGIAVSFASDGVGYREDAALLGEVFRRGVFHQWFAAPYPLHVKLYALCFAAFGPVLGFNILSGEFLNLFYYLGSLIVVCKLGEEIFARRAGLIAAGAAALWPSLLLHTTQVLKDPLFIFAMLGLVLIMTRLLTRTYSWRESLLSGMTGALLAALLWETRSDLGPVLVASIILVAGLFLLRQFQSERWLTANLAGVLLLMTFTAGAILWLPVYRDSDNPRHREREAARQAMPAKTQPSIHWWQTAAQVGSVRERFVASYPDASSNIDANVKLTTTLDVIRYLPRAAEIGLFAPFPNMWFTTGDSVGSIGRSLSGLETLFLYALEALAVVGLWRGRRQLSVWLLFSIALLGAIALGLVVVNIGSLYRLRYVFLILLIILAAEGMERILDILRKRQTLMKRVGS